MSNRFLRNTGWIVGGQIARLLLSLVINSLTARFLGPSDYGIVNYVTSLITFFTSLVSLGLSGVIVYELVSGRDREGTVLGTAITLRFFAGILSVIGFLALIRITDPGDETVFRAAALAAVQLPFLAPGSIAGWHQSRLQSKYSVLCQLLAYLTMSGYKVYLLITGASVELFSFAVSLDVIVLALLYLISYVRSGGARLGFRLSTAGRLLRSSLPFILADMMIFVYGQTDKIMLRHMLDSSEAVGYYSAAIAISGLISFLPAAILESARPPIMEAKSTDEAIYRNRLRLLYAALIWISLFYSLGVTCFARPIVYLLYGKAYYPAIPALRIAVWYTAFSYLGSGRSLFLICEKKNRFVSLFSAMGALTNIVLNLLLIPQLGIKGAALATLATQLLANFVYPALFPSTRAYSRHVLAAFLLRGISLHDLIATALRRRPAPAQSATTDQQEENDKETDE